MSSTQYTDLSNFDYMFDGKMTAILGCTATDEMVISIPPVIEGAPVGSIGFGAFSLCSNLRRVEIPDSVQTIENGAFRNCKKMEQIRLPASLESIGNASFADCLKLKKIIMPNNVKTEMNSFQGCSNLKYVEIYNNETHENRTFVIAMNSDVGRFMFITACMRAMDTKGSYMEKYDATFLEINDDEDRFEVAIFRLEDPWRLEERAKKIYMDAVRNSVEHWVKLDNVERVSKAGKFGCIDMRDIDDFIEISSRRRGDCTAYLLKYKADNNDDDEYDFSL